ATADKGRSRARTGARRPSKACSRKCREARDLPGRREGCAWHHVGFLGRMSREQRNEGAALRRSARAGRRTRHRRTHLLERFVDRERPDRRVVHGWRHGIPRSGNKWDSFPSGHAVQLGALATLGCRLAGRRVRPLLWPAALVLAVTRIVLLAHYASDVAAGLLLGALVGRTAAAALRDLDRGRGVAAHCAEGYSPSLFVNTAFPSPVPMVSTAQRSTSAMKDSSLSPCTSASLCSMTETGSWPIEAMPSLKRSGSEKRLLSQLPGRFWPPCSIAPSLPIIPGQPAPMKGASLSSSFSACLIRDLSVVITRCTASSRLGLSSA